ncbi:FGGY-family carbohydrate kinase [Micromonospora sp. NPDC023966]|uniref:FGGY-family carbohydrate kinase n=1 Tax=Micromonospora sp. NPDC023966 TaxID=3154699 RepID=UPI00340E5ED5
MNEVVIGLDVATADVRAVAVTPDGNVVARAAQPLPPPERAGNGRAEQSPVHADVAVAVLARLGADLRCPVRAVAVTATSGTVVPCSDDLAPVGQALLYNDRRAGQPGVGIDPGLVAAAPALARVAWLHRHRPAPRYRHVSDLVVARLTGEDVPTDTSHALKTGADPQTLRWSAHLLDAAEVPESRLPRLASPGTPVGGLSAGTASATGLAAGVPVVLGMTDGCTGQIAAGAVRTGDTVGVLGTTLVVKVAAPRRVADSALGVYSHLAPDRYWWAGGASNAGAGALRNAFPDADLAALDLAAAAHGPARTLRYPVPGRGERFPFVAPDAGGPLDDEAADPGEHYRALLDGVAYVERLALDVLAGAGAASRGAVRAVGGGSRSLPWLRIRATVLGRPLVVPAEASSAFGVAVLAASSAVHSDLAAAVDAMVTLARTVEPDPTEKAQLDGGYARFVDALVRRGWLSPHPTTTTQDRRISPEQIEV